MIKNFVIVKTASIQGVPQRSRERIKWRVVMADARHDTTLPQYLQFIPAQDYIYMPQLRVFNPSKFADFSLSWVVAQVAVHVPEIAVCAYLAQTVGVPKEKHKAYSVVDVARMAIGCAVYDWQGNIVKIQDEDGYTLW